MKNLQATDQNSVFITYRTNERQMTNKLSTSLTCCYNVTVMSIKCRLIVGIVICHRTLVNMLLKCHYTIIELSLARLYKSKACSLYVVFLNCSIRSFKFRHMFMIRITTQSFLIVLCRKVKYNIK